MMTDRHIFRHGRRVLIAILLSTSLGACGGGGPGPASEPLAPEVQEQPLQTASFADLGLDVGPWAALLAEIEARRLPIDQLGLLVDGKLLGAVHRDGLNARSLHDLRSVTKSVTSLLVGIAIDRGLIKGLDQPISDHFPEPWARGRPAAALSLRHLLAMRSGLDCDDWNPRSAGHEERMYAGNDWLRHFFDLAAVGAPGQTFSYCTAGLVVAGEVVARASGMPLPAFARQALFAPLGIAGERWELAPQQVTDAGGHLRLSLGAMLKLGELVRQGGLWQGRRIVSAEWLTASTASAGAIDPSGQATRAHMGLAWWLEPVRGGVARSYQARGTGGQYIMVLPEQGAVLAFTGADFKADLATQMAPFDLVQRHLLPMLNGRKR